MTFIQKKRLNSTFIFEIIDRKLKVTSKNFFSTNSYEISLNELSSNKVEQSNFSIKWLIMAIITLGITILLFIGGILVNDSYGSTPLITASIFSSILVIYTLRRLNRETFSYVHLCRKDNGVPVITFYNNNPTKEDLDSFINSVIDLVENNDRTGFATN